MTQTFSSLTEYIDSLSAEDQILINQLRDTINQNLPTGFNEQISYNMIGYIVPLTTYPKGYHCNPQLPLPFINIAAQKNFIAIYHMGIVADQNLREWFEHEYPKYSKAKLNMGKSCIRLKRTNIPYSLIGELAQKMSVTQWIEAYEKNYLN